LMLVQPGHDVPFVVEGAARLAVARASVRTVDLIIWSCR
jgi:hypothetical protein